jgi:hypothetical protein
MIQFIILTYILLAQFLAKLDNIKMGIVRAIFIMNRICKSQ